MARRRTQELTGMSVPGDPRIPYDRTDPMQQVAAPPEAAGPTGASLPGASLPPGAPDLGAIGQGTPPMVEPGGGLGGGAPDAGGLGSLLQAGGGAEGAPMGGTSDDLTGNDLAALSQPIGDLQSPEDQQIAAWDAALNDPNTPPEMVAQLQQMLDLAARRRLAGLGGTQQPQGGGLGA